MAGKVSSQQRRFKMLIEQIQVVLNGFRCQVE